MAVLPLSPAFSTALAKNNPPRPDQRPPGMAMPWPKIPTLGRYIAIRFTRSVLGVFAGVFVIVYAVDLVELLRKSGDSKEASGALIAVLALLRTPIVLEQILPFAVLFGAMACFLSLTRKLELIVARAAGISCWQFLTPPLLCVLAIGLFALTVYNPVAADLKQRANRIETKIFGSSTSDPGAAGFWIRQRSVDGQAIIKANLASDNGRVLGQVTVFAFARDGAFSERIEASRAILKQGYFELHDVRVITSNDAPEHYDTYLFASNLSREQVTQSFGEPDTVSFWDLKAVIAQMLQAGLDPVRYRLYYDTLLARPLMLMAMVLIAASFSLRFARFGGVSKMVLSGISMGFVLYVATKFVGDLGGAGLLSTGVAAWSPPVFGFMVGSFILLKQEDG